MRVRMVLAAAIAALALGAAACSEDSSDKSADKPDKKQESPATSAVIEVANNDELGQIVVDSKGLTLYRFDKDTAKPPTSNCSGACATAWPPVVVDSDKPEVKGIDSNLVGTVERSDGKKQLTLNGWPLYRYVEDENPGDTKGQGVGGTWFVANAEGKKASAASSPAPAPQSPSTPKQPEPSPYSYGY